MYNEFSLLLKKFFASYIIIDSSILTWKSFTFHYKHCESNKGTQHMHTVCYLLFLREGTEHDDTAALILHHHPPQVSSGVLQGTLSGYVPSPLLVALDKK